MIPEGVWPLLQRHSCPDSFHHVEVEQDIELATQSHDHSPAQFDLLVSLHHLEFDLLIPWIDMQHVEPIQNVLPAACERALLVMMLPTGIAVATVLFSAHDWCFDGRRRDEIAPTAFGDEVDESRWCVCSDEIGELVLRRNECDAHDAS